MSIKAAPIPFAAALDEFGDRTALITAEGTVSYRELARRADQVGRRLGPHRRLVLVAAANDVDTVVGYLAALRHGHPVLLTPREPDAAAAMIEAYEPDVVLSGPNLLERHPASGHSLHPELALLLSTSGSTGSPKLVRLSAENVQSNAEAIATFLDIRPDDRAATALPLHYCYGLSVLHSHLLRGAAVILTGLSVADADFWALFRRARGTTFPAVPYTFDLLDRIGFADLSLPDLRYITQAGGRLDPARVRQYARLGSTRGWDLVVMYGQTEATARMAYLPPELAATAPDAIGRPIPGGSLRIAASDGPGEDPPSEGELVYSGPNVMLGYAERPADLSRGREIDELYTGDLARLGDDGLYRIVGRRNRFLKLFGLRVDLQRVESRLAEHGVTAGCAGDDQTLVVAVEEVAGGDLDPATVRRRVVAATGLPASAVSVHRCARIPRLPSGKPDYPAIAALARAADPVPEPAPPGDRVSDLVRLYATILDRPDATPRHSFVDLGGDSLSYVEVSIHLEQVLGTLPADWHVLSIADLAERAKPLVEPVAQPGAERSVAPVAEPFVAPPAPGAEPADEPANRAAAAGEQRRRPRWRLRLVDTSVLLRAVAIVLVVGTHVQLFGLPGGAHMLLGVAGYNFARFRLIDRSRGARVRGIARSLGLTAVATISWVALVMLVSDQYTLANLFLANRIVGPDAHPNAWHFWFIEDLVYLVVGATVLLSVSVVDRWERRWPFALPLAVMAIGLVARYQLVPGVELPATLANAWLFAIGWAAAKASGRSQRVALTVALVATVPGFFGNPTREAIVIGGLALLIWARAIPVTRTIAAAAGALASASLYIYLVHWQVYPRLWDVSLPLAVVASLAAGLGYAVLFRRASRHLAAARRRVAQYLRTTGRRVTRTGGRLDSATEGALN